VTDAVTADYKGTYSSPPTAPTKPPAGKNLWVISCGQIAVGCSTPSNAAAEAARAVGWKVTVYDGKLGADNAYATGVRQAVAAKADAIIIAAFDCAYAKQPLQEAKTAGIKVVSLLGYDCDDPRVGGGASLFTASVIPNENEKTVAAYSIAQGKMKADWAMAQTDGKAVALSLNNTGVLLGQDIAKGFDDEIKTCSTCQLVSLPFTLTDIGSGALPGKVGQALLRNPAINSAMVPYDALMALGVAQAFVRSGRNDKLATIGGEGYGVNLDLIKKNGGQDAAVYESTAWFGYAAVDSLIRLFNGDPQQPAGIGSQLVDKSHLPAMDKGGIVPPVDFKAAYLKAWGK
jgi:ribose transport system substrate-binding protein